MTIYEACEPIRNALNRLDGYDLLPDHSPVMLEHANCSYEQCLSG